MIARCIVIALLTTSAWAQTVDWQSEVRALAERKDFEAALAVVQQRVLSNDADWEARAWKARLLAWTSRWAEAEAEYRIVLEKAPNDSDVLSGLADVLLWQGKLTAALAILDRAASLLPEDRAIAQHRARVRERLHPRPEPRHELRLGSDTETFNYTDAATAESLALTSRWNARWTTSFTSTFYQRFGADAQRVTARVSRKLGTSTWFGVTAGAGHDEGVIPKREAGFEIGRGFRLPNAIVRGMEVTYGQQWLWFRGSKVLVVSGTNLLYLPRDYTFTVTLAEARGSFHLPDIEWRPAGSARLAFPIHQRVRAHLGFALGTENFAKANALGRFAARTFSGGLKYQLSAMQDISGVVAVQDRSQGRAQTSVGISYGIRF